MLHHEVFKALEQDWFIGSIPFAKGGASLFAKLVEFGWGGYGATWVGVCPKSEMRQGSSKEKEKLYELLLLP